MRCLHVVKASYKVAIRGEYKGIETLARQWKRDWIVRVETASKSEELLAQKFPDSTSIARQHHRSPADISSPARRSALNRSREGFYTLTTAIPSKLNNMLQDLCLCTSFCNWILEFLICRPETTHLPHWPSSQIHRKAVCFAPCSILFIHPTCSWAQL